MKTKKNNFFAPGEEFRRIESLFSKKKFTRGILGDDAFLEERRPGNWAVSSDASVEGVHYRLDWVSPGQALKKAVISNLSDIHAMGGRTAQLFLNLGFSPSWNSSVYRELGKTLRRLEKKFGFEVCGGDMVRCPSGSFFSITVAGPVPGKALKRASARPGHSVYLTGSLGAPAAGLALLQKQKEIWLKNKKNMGWESLPALKKCVAEQAVPRFNHEVGPALSRLKREFAAIDISDGLSSELHHLAAQSGCGFIIDEDLLPRPRSFPRYFRPEIIRTWVLHGGESYNLLFTGVLNPPQLRALRQYDRVVKIGEAVAGKGVFLRSRGKNIRLQPKGWNHSA